MKRKVICVIEDDPNYLVLTKKMIEFTSMADEILTFKNGKEAFEGITKLKLETGHFPDIIFIDINMPIWDAWDFLDEFSQVKSDWEGSIFIVTSSIDRVDEKKSSEYTFVKEYLRKPLAFSKLLDVMNTN